MFDIQKESRIVLYGHSQFDIVKDKFRELKERGYQVLGYIDQRAKEIETYVQAPCWTVEDFPVGLKERQDIVIILLLQNARMHESIVSSLCGRGFKKFLFIPEKADTSEKTCMVQKYNAFIRSEYDELMGIPEWDSLCLNSVKGGKRFLKCGKERCTLLVPVEMLFLYEQEQSLEENIAFAEDYLELFAVLEGKAFECGRYFDFMGAVEKEEKEKLLADRLTLYCLWEHYRHCDINYFIEAAALVSWNRRGYFNIIDGHHRVIYLMAKGYKKIPVSMPLKDYDKWIGEADQALSAALRRLRVPIPHPFFLNEECIYETHWQKVIHYLYAAGQSRDCRFVEIDTYMGYYAGAFQRIVKKEALIVLENETDKRLCESMQRLMHQKIPILNYPEVMFRETDLVYLKLAGNEEASFMRFIKDVTGQCILLDIPWEEEGKTLKEAVRILGGDLKQIGSYHRDKAYGIYVIERSVGNYGRGDD